MLIAFIRFLVYSNIWISLGATFFTYLFYIISQTEINCYFLVFIFSSTLTTYTFQRYMKLRSGENISGPRMDWMIRNSTLSNSIIVGGAIITVVLSLTLSVESLFVLIGLGFISFFYAYEIKMNGEKKSNLRDIPRIKIFLIAIVWGLSCCILPYIQNDIWSNEVIWPITTAFSLYILAICIPFDIRDIELDEKRKRTIPQLTGIPGAKILAILITISSYLILILVIDFHSIGLLIGYLITVLLIILASKEKNELFFSFIMDGLLVLMPSLVYFIT